MNESKMLTMIREAKERSYEEVKTVSVRDALRTILEHSHQKVEALGFQSKPRKDELTLNNK
ncbi:MAG: hypothetical protein AABZ39_14355 [Spirochaetota bacterium]